MTYRKFVIEPYPDWDTTLALIGTLFRDKADDVTVLYRKREELKYLTEWIADEMPEALESGRLHFVPVKNHKYDPKKEKRIAPEEIPDYKTLDHILAKHTP